MLIFIAKASAPLVVFWSVLILFVYGIIWILKKNHWLAMPALILFGAGTYIAFALFAMVLSGSPVIILTNTLLILGIWIFMIRRRRFEKYMASMMPQVA